MWEVIKSIAWETIQIFNEAAIFVLFGLLIAGLLHVFYPREKVVQALGKRGIGSILKAALLGIPLPLCSCGVTPMALSLRKHGASRGATISFLISTPETGVDSLAVSYALLGPIMTIFRPISALLTAMTAGIAEDTLNDKDEVANTTPQTCNVCGHSDEGHDHNHSHGTNFKRAMEYAFVDMMEDISKWFVIGIILAGIISAVVPHRFFENYLGSGMLSMLVMLSIGIPMYICASASTPIAAALILKGLSPGAALVFLLTGPATNMASILLLGKSLGRRSIAIYLISIASMSIIMGLILNQIYPYLGATTLPTAGKAAESIPEAVSTAGSVILAGLIIYSLAKGKHGECESSLA